MSKDAAASAQADARKPEVRPARVWQPTDLRHPIAPESGFVASAWRTQREPVFGLTDFDIPTVDLLPPPATPDIEEAPEAAAVAPAPPPVIETPVATAEALAKAREEGRAQGAA